MSELKINLNDFAQDIVDQLKALVPVRTGRLRNGIRYRIEERKGSYFIYLVTEDYFAWLKPKTKPSRLPSPKEMAMASPPLPKMDDLGKMKVSDLSPRARGILSKIDIDSAIEKIDFTDLEEQLRKIIFYDMI